MSIFFYYYTNFSEGRKLELLDILNDYKKNFCNRICCIETEYKEMKFVKIYFSETDLHHLLGLHKVLTGINATKSIEFIKSRKITRKNIKKHRNYGMIRSRIDSYDFLSEVFLQKSIEICIVEKDINPNTMYLNLIIYKKKGYEIVVLGLKKSNKLDIYYLATLHKAYENKYSDVRKTKIKDIRWID